MSSQKKSPVVGLTGGIASGKSAVSQMLRDLGAAVIDADRIARDVLVKGTAAYDRVVAHFGSEILLVNEEIDRRHLGRIIFADKVQRHQLNQIVHPAVIAEIEEQIAHWQSVNPSPQAIVVEVPLLFEVGMQGMFDQIWVVWVDQAKQVERLCLREGLSPDEAKQRINAQMSLTDKREMADEIIDNSGSLDQVRDQVISLWRKFTVETPNDSANCSRC